MNQEEVLRSLSDRGAVRSGHFLLSSGKHSDTYVEKAQVFEDPALTVRLAEEVAGWYDLVFPLRALTRVSAEAWDPGDCPRCAERVPIESPGSSRLA